MCLLRAPQYRLQLSFVTGERMSIEQLQQIVSGVRYVSLHYRQCRLERSAAPAERSPPRPLSLDHSCLRSRSRLKRYACTARCCAHGHDVSQ